MIETHSLVFYYIIKVYNPKGRELIEVLRWDNLRWNLRLKYDWYFKYRAALLQVKYPRFKVEINEGNEPATGKTLQQINDAKIKSKKANISKYKNLLQKAVENWDSLYPIEDDVFYKKAIAKIKRLECELESIIQTNRKQKNDISQNRRW